MNIVNQINQSEKLLSTKALLVGFLMLVASNVQAGIEASISMLPKAAEQTTFLTDAENTIDQSLFEHRLITAAKTTQQDQWAIQQFEIRDTIQRSNSEWKAERRQQHLYKGSLAKNQWPLLSIRIHQGDVALTMGSKYATAND